MQKPMSRSHSLRERREKLFFRSLRLLVPERGVRNSLRESAVPCSFIIVDVGLSERGKEKAFFLSVHLLVQKRGVPESLGDSVVSCSFIDGVVAGRGQLEQTSKFALSACMQTV